MRIFAIRFREHSSVGLEHLPYKQRVGGSTPSAPTKSLGEIQGFFRCIHSGNDAIRSLRSPYMAIKTAHFLAEMLFGRTLATKSAYFLAVCFDVLASVFARTATGLIYSKE